MQARLGPNPTPQRYSTNFIEWDDTPSFANSLSQFGQRLDRHDASVGRARECAAPFAARRGA